MESPYVFVNTEGRPILQVKLRKHWARVMKKSGLKYHRMYEARHTFASWALTAGKTTECQGRDLNLGMAELAFFHGISSFPLLDGHKI
jgi:integrase